MAEPGPISASGSSGEHPEYPEHVAAALVRSIGAFIRVAQTQKLTPTLRRLRSFRPQTLLRHRDAVLVALEDEDLRASLIEWLDDGQVPLSKDDASILRMATARPEGWKEQLTRPEEVVPVKAPDPRAELRGLEARLAREQDKVRAARSSARRIKDEARRNEEAAAQRIEGLEAAGAELRAARAEADEAVRDAEHRAAAAERAARRAIRTAERAAAEAEADRKRLRELSKELGKEKRRNAGLESDADRLRAEVDRLRAEVDGLKAEMANLREHAAEVEAGGGTRRRVSLPVPLPVPKGRMPEDPQTLAEWLAAPDVGLLVDGYNVTKAEGGYGDLALELQRERLIDAVRALVARSRVSTVIVFDGSEVMPGAARRMQGGVAVEYSKPSESADDHIIALLEGMDGPVIVVTNDRDLQRRAAALGATIATSIQLLALIR